MRDVSLKILEKISEVTGELLASFLTQAALTLLIVSLLYFLWRKLTSTYGLQKLGNITLFPDPPVTSGQTKAT